MIDENPVDTPRRNIIDVDLESFFAFEIQINIRL